MMECFGDPIHIESRTGAQQNRDHARTVFNGKDERRTPSRPAFCLQIGTRLDYCDCAGNPAHACIYGFAIKAFQHYGMDYDAYTLINRGFAGFRPHEDSYSICSTESFLVLLTSNAKFESYAEYARRTPGRGQDVATD